MCDTIDSQTQGLDGQSDGGEQWRWFRPYTDGSVFIPEKPCEISKGSKVTLTVSVIETDLFEKQKKLADFKKLTKEINELNKTDPLPAEFDEILSQRVRIREIPSL